jgi:hypothetical protein
MNYALTILLPLFIYSLATTNTSLSSLYWIKYAITTDDDNVNQSIAESQ